MQNAGIQVRMAMNPLFFLHFCYDVEHFLINATIINYTAGADPVFLKWERGRKSASLIILKFMGC